MAAPQDPTSDDAVDAPGAAGPAGLVAAILAGDIARIGQMLDAEPDLAHAVVNGRSMLHHANDWPGHRPNVAATIGLLVAAGADPSVQFPHPTSAEANEQPIHWAASNDDVEAVAALIKAGADVNALGGIFGGCTPFEEAIIFEQFNAARLLLEHGALNYLPGAAALGQHDQIENFFDQDGTLRMDVGILANWPADITRQTILDRAFQFACRSGHLAIAQIMLERGADPTAITPADTSSREEAANNDHDDVVAWLDSLDATAGG